MALATPAPDDQVTISVVQDNNGDWYYVAKKRNKTLWKLDSFGPIFDQPGKIFHDNPSGMYVLESQNVLLVDRYGKVRKQLEDGAAYSPRFISLKDGNLVYDTGNLHIAHYDPKRDEAQLAAWLRQARRVVVYNVRTLRYEWNAAESDIGIPLSCNNRYLDTMSIVNLTECLEDDKKTPIVSIDKIDIRTKHRLSSAILSITRPEALDLIGEFLGVGPISPAKVMWTATGVHVYGLYSGQDKKVYTGKIKKSATRKSKNRK